MNSYKNRAINFSNRRWWLVIRDYCIGWTLAFIFYIIIRGEGTKELGSVQWGVSESMLRAFIIGPILGLISGYAQILTEKYGYKRISIQKLLALRFAYVILFLAVIILLAYAFFGVNIGLLEFAFEPGSLSIYLYIVSVDIFNGIKFRIIILSGRIS